MFTSESLIEGVDLIEQTEARFDSGALALRNLSDTKAQAHPRETARFVAHLLRNTQQSNFWDYDALHEIVRIVNDSAPVGVVDSIRSNALRLGATGAQDW